MKHIKNNIIVYWYFLLILFAEIWLVIKIIKMVMTKLNWVFLISLVCALSGFVLLEEVGRTFYAGFLSICGCTIAFVTGIFSLLEYEDKNL